MTIPAKYDTDRNRSGQFVPGNRASVNNNTEIMQRFKQLQSLWYGATCLEDMELVREELKKCCTQDKNLDVKMKACIYFCDRLLGKVPEHVSVDVAVEQRSLNVNLSPEEADVLARIVERS